MFESIITYIYEVVIPYWQHYRFVIYHTSKKVLKDLEKIVDEFGGATN